MQVGDEAILQVMGKIIKISTEIDDGLAEVVVTIRNKNGKTSILSNPEEMEKEQ